MSSQDSMRATIADVARRANVSIATVSRVVNNTGQVAEETRARVARAIQDLHYTPQDAAKGLASRRTHRIGLVVKEINGAFFQPLLRGIEETMRGSGYDLLIHATHETSAASTAGYALGSHNTDGLIVYTGSMAEQEILRLHAIGFPLVLLYQTPPRQAAIPHIVIENVDGTYRLIRHLITLGRRRIAFLEGPHGNEDSHWRKIGYEQALIEHGLALDEGLVGYGGFMEQFAHETVKQWLDARLNFDAVFAGADDAALGVLAAVREHGLRIPEDIAVVGFDDIRLAHHLTPALTTIRAPIRETGQTAVKHLLAIIRGEQRPIETRLPVELVIRESCGA